MSERKQFPSASGYEALMLCRGKHNLEMTVPETDDSTEESRAGDRIHAAMAGITVDLSEDESAIVERFKRQESEMVEQFIGTPLLTPRESRIWLTRDETTFSGKPDLVAIGTDATLITDYKSGWLDVTESARNPQLRALVVLVDQDCARPPESPIYVAVLSRFGNPDVAKYEPDDIELAREELMGVLRSAAEPDAPRTPGDKQCRFCRAKTACPEANGTVNTLATIKPGTLSTDNLLRLLDLIGPAESVIKAAKAQAKEMLEINPKSLPGWHLEPGDIREKIVNITALYGRCEAVGVTNEDFTAGCTMTKKNLEAMLRKATGKNGKELSRQMNAALDGLLVGSQNAPSLKRD